MADSETIEYLPVTTLTRGETECLANRLYSRAASTLLLAACERGTGRQVSILMLAGGC